MNAGFFQTRGIRDAEELKYGKRIFEILNASWFFVGPYTVPVARF